MITEEDLQRPRTARELREFLDQIFTVIQKNVEARQAARSRKGLYKQLIEELWPLSWYFATKYGDTNFKLTLQLGNQGFDAMVLGIEGNPVEWMEVSWPIDGQKHAAVVRLLNEQGHGPVENYDDPLQKLREVFARTMEGARRKAVRDYKAKGCSSLALVVDVLPYYHAEIQQHRQEVERFAAELGGLKYNVDEVVLLLSPPWQVITIQSNKVIEPGSLRSAHQGRC